MKTTMLKMLVLVGLLFGAIFGYHLVKKIMIKRYLSSHATPVITVSSMTVKKESWQPRLNAVGTLRAIKGVDVTTELAGMVRKIHFKPGSYVKKNTPLVKLNDDTEVAQLHSLQANYSLAKITYNRDKAQFEVNAVSKQIVDNDYANLKNMAAQVAEQQSVVAKKNIRAPFSGHLGINYINPGQYVNPGDKIVTLQTLDPIYVDFSLPQQDILKLKVGERVSLTSDSFEGKTFEGKITTIDPKVDVATRNIQVEATIANPSHLLLPGMFANVKVKSGKPHQYLTVPQTAISFNPYGEIVFVITEDEANSKKKKFSFSKKKPKKKLIAKQKFVTVGQGRGDQYAVLKGLKEGDVVVTAGQLKLKNNSEVKINNSIKISNDPDPKVPNE